MAGGSADSDDLPDIIPISDRPDIAPAEVPFGLCHCGCGRKTRISTRNDPTKGWIKGQPRRFLSGHNGNGHRYPG